MLSFRSLRDEVSSMLAISISLLINMYSTEFVYFWLTLRIFGGFEQIQ